MNHLQTWSFSAAFQSAVLNATSVFLTNICLVLLPFEIIVEILCFSLLLRRALKTVDELVQKIQFDGPSIQINSKNLAVGILALNTTMFNETTLSAFMSPNKSDPQVTAGKVKTFSCRRWICVFWFSFDCFLSPQIDFKSKRPNPLAQVTLPASLLSRVSHAEADTPSRISFMFFNSPSFFQVRGHGVTFTQRLMF